MNTSNKNMLCWSPHLTWRKKWLKFSIFPCTGVSLSDILLVEPSVHSSLIDVLLRFCAHLTALTDDVSRMYRGVFLDAADKDLHRSIWRSSLSEPLSAFCMTLAPFGVATLYYADNMAVKQNAFDLVLQYPLAATAVEQSFYVDDVLTGADSVEEAINVQQ